MKLNETEKEVIFLKAITELIDNMVNFEVVKLLSNDPESEIHFKSRTHLQYFNIILLDLLSCTDKKILGVQSSYLGALKKICTSPYFNKDNSVKNLTQSTMYFVDWLEKVILVEDIWLPSIELQTNLLIKRIEFIKICGNISKHNFSRLSGVVKELIEIFKRNEIHLTEEKTLLIINEFYEWFHTDIFHYHSSAIAEFLNNIRWGIYYYLLPEFKHSLVYDTDTHPRMYHYIIPDIIQNSFAKSCYWDLMNEIRFKPYLKQFQVTRFLKMRY